MEPGGGGNNRPQTDGFQAEKAVRFGAGRGWGSRSPTSFLPPLFDFVHLFFCLSQKAPNHHRGGEAAGPSRVPFAPLWAAKAVGLHRHNGVAGIHGPLPATSIHPPLAASIPIPAPASMPFPTTTRTASRRGLGGLGGRARHDPDPRSWDPSPPPRSSAAFDSGPRRRHRVPSCALGPCQVAAVPWKDLELPSRFHPHACALSPGNDNDGKG